MSRIIMITVDDKCDFQLIMCLMRISIMYIGIYRSTAMIYIYKENRRQRAFKVKTTRKSGEWDSRIIDSMHNRMNSIRGRLFHRQKWTDSRIRLQQKPVAPE